MKTKLMNRCFAFFGAIAMLTILQLAAYGQDFKYDDDNASKDLAEIPEIYGPRIAGVWKTAVRITNCNGVTLFGFESMGLFGADGTFLDTNVTDPKLRSSAFGYWDHVKGNQYRFVSRWFRFDAAGAYVGSTVVRHIVVLSQDGESYESSGTGTNYVPDGSVDFVGCSEASAERFR